jgi:hypothetical protein
MSTRKLRLPRPASRVEDSRRTVADRSALFDNRPRYRST